MAVYTCGGDIFESLSLAIEYANVMYMENGIILGIEEIVWKVIHLFVARQDLKQSIIH